MKAELDFTPFPGSWPVGKIFLHIAESEDYWIHYLARKELTGESALRTKGLSQYQCNTHEIAEYPKNARSPSLNRLKRRIWIGALKPRAEKH